MLWLSLMARRMTSGGSSSSGSLSSAAPMSFNVEANWLPPESGPQDAINGTSKSTIADSKSLQTRDADTMGIRDCSRGWRVTNFSGSPVENGVTINNMELSMLSLRSTFKTSSHWRRRRRNNPTKVHEGILEPTLCMAARASSVSSSSRTSTDSSDKACANE